MVIRKGSVIALVMLGAPHARAELLYNGFTKTATETIASPGLQPTELTGLSGPTFEVFSLDQANNSFFGPTDGITGITLTFAGVVEVDGAVVNNNKSGNVTGFATSSVNFSFTAVNASLNTALGAVDLVETIKTNTAVVGPEGNGIITGSNAPGVNASPLMLSSALFPLFTFSAGQGVGTGGGVVDIGANTLTSDSAEAMGGGGQAQIGIATEAGASVSIVYQYGDPRLHIPGSPEPSTWAMMLIGFAALGYAGYRRSREPRAA